MNIPTNRNTTLTDIIDIALNLVIRWLKCKMVNDISWRHTSIRQNLIHFNIVIANIRYIASYHSYVFHDDVIKWKPFPRYPKPYHRSSVNSPHKGQWRGALMFSLISAWINGRVNNRYAGVLKPHRAHYDVILLSVFQLIQRIRSWVNFVLNLLHISSDTIRT